MKVTYEKKFKPIMVGIDRQLSDVPHLHNEIEVIYVEKGNALAYADHSCYKLQDGDIFISFPNQIHYYNGSELGSYYIMIFSADLIYGQKALINSSIPESNILEKTAELAAVIKEINGCFASGRETECVGYLNIFMGRLLSGVKLIPALATDNSTLRKILDYCSENFSDELSLNSVSEQLHLSKYYISHLLNRKLSLGFNDYVNLLRVRAACDLLLESDKKIADISEDVGFGTIRSLNRAFRQVLNMTPLEYRNMQRGLK